MVAAPPESEVAADVKPPPESTTEPVGVELPLPPLTVTLTDKDCAFVMPDADGMAVTVGVVLVGVVTATVVEPVAPL
jgi:hypothetical protein